MLKAVTEFNAKDIRELKRALKEIEPGLVQEMAGEIRKIARPIERQIKSNIPKAPPTSGMGGVVKIRNKQNGNVYYAINEGRLRWDGQGTNPPVGKIKKRYRADDTSISQSIKSSGRSLTTPLAKVILQSAAASVADMAGRVGRGASISREYTVRLRNGDIVKRRHKVTSQGNHFVSLLAGRASRYGWPALESKIDEVEREIEKVIENYYRKANRGN